MIWSFSLRTLNNSWLLKERIYLVILCKCKELKHKWNRWSCWMIPFQAKLPNIRRRRRMRGKKIKQWQIISFHSEINGKNELYKNNLLTCLYSCTGYPASCTEMNFNQFTLNFENVRSKDIASIKMNRC